MTIHVFLKQSIALCEALARDPTLNSFPLLVKDLVEHFSAQRPLLVCGNGGSAADALHITAELVGRFKQRRQALPCLCLNANTATLSAWSNDVGFETAFARQVEAYGQSGGALLAISTSGNSANIIAAAKQARAQQMTVLGLSGRNGGALAEHCDYLLCVPSDDTAMIQQGHLCLYHYLCEQLEAALTTPSSLDQ